MSKFKDCFLITLLWSKNNSGSSADVLAWVSRILRVVGSQTLPVEKIPAICAGQCKGEKRKK